MRIIFALTLAVAGGLGGCSASEEGSPSAAPAKKRVPVVVATVALGDVQRSIVVSTSLIPAQRATLTPEVGGVIREITKSPGDRVRKGEKLVVVASTAYEVALDAARAQLAAAEATAQQMQVQLTNAQLRFQRHDALQKDKAVTQAELDAARSGLRGAEAAVAAAKARRDGASAQIRSATKQVRDTVLKAPFDGFVVKRLMDPGEVVQPGRSPVLVVVDPEPLYAACQIGELDSPSVRVGMAAQVHLDAFEGRAFEGEVAVVNQELDAQTRSVHTRVRVKDEEGLLRAGFSGTVEVPMASVKRVVVPRVALLRRRRERAQVFVVEGGIARLRDVEVDPAMREHIEIRAGLSAGDKVVVEGHTGLSHGQPVEARATPAGKAKTAAVETER